MSKKNNKSLMQTSGSSSGMSHEAEYRIIKFDLVKVVALNIVYLVVILGLYFANQSSGFLDKFFARLLHF